jgi:hypothetical protein
MVTLSECGSAVIRRFRTIHLHKLARMVRAQLEAVDQHVH